MSTYFLCFIDCQFFEITTLFQPKGEYFLYNKGILIGHRVTYVFTMTWKLRGGGKSNKKKRTQKKYKSASFSKLVKHIQAQFYIQLVSLFYTFFMDFFFKIMKLRPEIAGITNCEITKFGVPL